MYAGKIFCVGFHKTGTTSLGAALTQLGYRVVGPTGVARPRIADEALELAISMVPDYDAFQDNPWPLLYRELEERFPGSKFILTRRPSDPWMDSVAKHFGGGTTPMREWIYGPGDPIGHEPEYRARYERHNAEVLAYFADRPDDLLILEMPAEFSWQPLCQFLSCGVPPLPFPRENTALDRERRRRHSRSLRSRGRRWLRKLRPQG